MIFFIFNRFEEYPKLKELIRLKDELIASTASPPMYLKCDLKSFNLKELGSKFDVILIEPPLEEYQRSLGVTNVDLLSWDQVLHIYSTFISGHALKYLMAKQCILIISIGTFT